MTTEKWKLPASEDTKSLLIKSIWGRGWKDVLNGGWLLWYEIGDITSLTDEECASITQELFVGQRGSGSIELHRSRKLDGAPMILCLRGNLRLHPALIIRGRYCPLYTVADPAGSCINFYSVWLWHKFS